MSYQKLSHVLTAILTAIFSGKKSHISVIISQIHNTVIITGSDLIEIKLTVYWKYDVTTF